MKTERLCLSCNKKPPFRGYDPINGYPFKGSYFFCSKNCKGEWVLRHPESDLFVEEGSNKGETKFCPECNKRLKEIYDLRTGESKLFCKYCKKV